MISFQLIDDQIMELKWIDDSTLMGIQLEHCCVGSDDLMYEVSMVLC